MSFLEMLPDFYGRSKEMGEIQAALEKGFSNIIAAKEEFMANLFAETATKEGLPLWERDYGLEGNGAENPQFRRERVLGKIRSRGTTTKDTILNVARSFSGGEVEVKEIPEEYRFTITFAGTMGIPGKMEDLTAALEEIKPAHLAYTYVYIFLLNSEVGKYTHGQLGAYTQDQIRNGRI